VSCSRIALCCSLPLAATFAGLPPSSSDLAERKGRCSAISSCTQLAAGAGARCTRALFERSAARTSRIRRRRRRSHRIARRRAAEERADTLLVGERRQSRRLSPARSGASGSEQSNRGKNASARFSVHRWLRAAARDSRRSQLEVVGSAVSGGGPGGDLCRTKQPVV
jgi:hypothetical protein